MELFDYKDAMKIFSFIYKHRKTININKIGKAIKWIAYHPETKKYMLRLAFIQRYISVPTYYIGTIALGCCNSLSYLFKTQNIYGFIGIMLLYALLAHLGAKYLLKATPKVKIILTEV